ncbi:MAG TPA: hypothetical protein VFJ47_01710, partial [Terriglobales bacterium]|nr:hypothetical protein [Terriglobales bacterium]
PDVNRLRAADAANRWRRFGWRCVESSCTKKFAQHRFVGCGSWRDLSFSSLSEWPASWTQMERAKFLSPDRNWLYKFEGLGRFGKKSREGALCLREAGFGRDAYEDYAGFVRYPWLRARPLSARDLSQQILDRIAAYCAFRARNFRVANPPVQQLKGMVVANLEKEFGADDALSGRYFDLLQRDSETSDMLVSDSGIVTDGRMQPHEWLLQEDGMVLKTDGTSHGEDHFFPGPTDIAWDLAGAALEWEMRAEATNYLLSQYERLSNDDARPRFPAFLLAYVVFRMGYCKMACEAEAGSTEEMRLRDAYYRYREKVQGLLAAHRQSISLPSSAVVE